MLPAQPDGDLLQAGPLLVMDGRSVVDVATDIEGFRAGSRQFDSDITDGRYPRAAIGYDDTYVYGVVVDGRSDSDVGMTLTELATYMTERLGVVAALNLDGGGSATLVARDTEGAFHVMNSPMDGHMQPTPGGSREVYSAIVFTASVARPQAASAGGAPWDLGTVFCRGPRVGDGRVRFGNGPGRLDEEIGYADFTSTLRLR